MGRFYLVTAGLFLGLVASGCRERNPAYIGKVAPDAPSVSKDVPVDETGPEDVFVVPPDVPAGDDIAQAGDAGSDRYAVTPDGEKPADDGGAVAVDAGDARDARKGGDDGADVAGDGKGQGDTPREVAVSVEGGPFHDASDAPLLPAEVGLDAMSLETRAVDSPPACLFRPTRS